ncbi:probable palmitoyltransferase ZDHHC24 [Lingula anatina]|uniref:Palmitoyltransferase n=1 Tax=Lingula anatina TaxID=7574 RepID=A0A1S3JYF7_LINAN|nr:probable palmitoyltransferase ZDHHC24 [Lingula anatina]|eukprot:XP_013415450.1 probable palmitoyltransferase ZDHHC24 [Lingula anatina]
MTFNVFWPRTVKDRVALAVFMLIGGPLMFCYEVLVVIPTYYSVWTLTAYIHVIFGLVLAVSIYWNVYNVRKNFPRCLVNGDRRTQEAATCQGHSSESRKEQFETKSETAVTLDHFQGNQRPSSDAAIIRNAGGLQNLTGHGTGTETEGVFCSLCQNQSPPRSFHCELCDGCVRLQDHHCWFAGCCIGQHNQKQYVYMMLSCWLLALYGNVLNFSFNVSTLGLNHWTPVILVAPHIALMFGYLSFYEFFVAGLTSVGMFLFGLFTRLLYAQAVQMITGQTRYERKKGIKVQSSGFKRNVEAVFGRNSIVYVIINKIHSFLGYRDAKFR